MIRTACLLSSLFGVGLAAIAAIPTPQYTDYDRALAEWTTQKVEPRMGMSPQALPLLGVAGVLFVGGLAGYALIDEGEEEQAPQLQMVMPMPARQPMRQPIYAGANAADEDDEPLGGFADSAPRPASYAAAAIDPDQEYDPFGGINGVDARWVEEALAQGFVVVYGRKGGGKTSKLGYAVQKFIERGYEVMVIDPHCQKGKWKGLKVWGAGLNYLYQRPGSASDGIKKFIREVKDRYIKMAEQEGYNPVKDEPCLVLACDEVSNWGSNVDPSVMAELLEVLLADLRKANAIVWFAAHGKTLAFLGGNAAKGKAKAIEEDATYIHVFSEVIPGTSPPEYQPLPFVEFKTPNHDVPIRAEMPTWFQAPPNYDYRPFIEARSQQGLMAELKAKLHPEFD